jgi:hypothetical protein
LHTQVTRQILAQVRVVKEAIEIYEAEGKPLPAPTSGRDFVNRMQNVA